MGAKKQTPSFQDLRIRDSSVGHVRVYTAGSSKGRTSPAATRDSLVVAAKERCCSQRQYKEKKPVAETRADHTPERIVTK
jgi:hypothetical protein